MGHNQSTSMGQNQSTSMGQNQSTSMGQNQSTSMGQNQSNIEENQPTKAGQIAIGIDLGTTYTCMGVWKNGKVEIIPNEQGNRITPSYVSFNEVESLIGEAAKNLSFSNPSNTIFDAKRLIGRRFTDTNVQSDMRLWPFKVVAHDIEDKPMVAVKYKGEEKLFAPEDISTMVLSKMKENSATFLGCEVQNAVVTVPAYFNGSQRRSTRIAGTTAGLNVLRITNEPSAAALAYAHNNVVKNKKIILVFDLGGGTFDVSLVEIEDGVVQVKATAGDTHLGGEDFDNRMVAYLFDEFTRKHGMDERKETRARSRLKSACERVKKNLSLCCTAGDIFAASAQRKHGMGVNKEARARSRLKSACERAKRSLSFSNEVTVEVECFYMGIDFLGNFSRANFEALNMDLFDKCITILEGCLKDAKVDKSKVDEVVLVGGSTRIPKVQEMVRNFFQGKALCHGLHADEAVAYGAAIQAAMLEEEPSLVPKMVLKDVTPISLGLVGKYDLATVVIPRNSSIPIENIVSMTLTEDNQTSVNFPIYEGERSMGSDNNLIGSITLEGVHPVPAYVQDIRVVFRLDEDGILNVSAKDLTSGNEVTATITNENGRLKQEEINRMLADAKTHELEDNIQMRKANARGQLRSFAYKTRNTVREPSNASKLQNSEVHKIEHACAEAIQWCDQNAADVTENECLEKKRELNKVCKGIIAKLRP